MPVTLCLDALAGLGVRINDRELHPFLGLDYATAVDDGQGDTTIRVDFSKTYMFPGVWNVKA